jgi:hypothetical protein
MVIKMKDNASAKIITATYQDWLRGIDGEHLPDNVYVNSEINRLYQHACAVIKPYQDKLSAPLVETDIEPVTASEKGFAGLYLSALLNQTAARSLTVNKTSTKLFGVGYRLQPGKTLEIGKDAKLEYVGWGALGGTINSFGEGINEIGTNAESLTILNHGRATKIACKARNTTVINDNQTDWLGLFGKDNRIVNLGKVREACLFDKGSTIIDMGRIKEVSFCETIIVTKHGLKATPLTSSRSFRLVGPKELRKDVWLKGIVEEMELLASEDHISRNLPTVISEVDIIKDYVKRAYPVVHLTF